MEALREHLSTGVLFEITSVALHGVLYPFGLKPRAVKSAGPGRTRPVILIHGYGHNRSCFLPLELYLRAVGFDRIFPFTYSSPDNIEQVAGALKDFIEQVRSSCASGRHTVDLVAHSLGGLAARVYLQDLGGARHVDQCLTLATPHYGTYSSYWTPTAIGRQMRPESEFMARLNHPDHRAGGVRYYSLWAEQDLWFCPVKTPSTRKATTSRSRTPDTWESYCIPGSCCIPLTSSAPDSRSRPPGSSGSPAWPPACSTKA